MLAKRGEIDWRAPGEAIEKYALLDVNAGTSGNAGGDA
jgi:pyruvate dehydrogenase E1 component